MQSVDPRLVRTLSWIAGVVALLVTITLPLGYFLIGYRHQLGLLKVEVEINARVASEVVNANPELWRFQVYKLKEFLSRRPRRGHPERRRIFDSENKILAESADPLTPPIMTWSQALLDSGVPVGRIEISRCMTSLLARTGMVAVYSLILGFGVFGTLRVLPLRALHRALVDNTRLLKMSRSTVERMEALRAIDRAIIAELELGHVMDRLLEETSQSVPAVAASTVRLVNQETQEMESVACHNLDRDEWKAVTSSVKGGVRRMLPRDDAPLMILNISEDPRSLAPDFLRKYGLAASFRIPLKANSRTLGVLTFFTKQTDGFSDDDASFLTAVGDQAAIAIENARLYEDSRKQAAELEKAVKVKDEFLSVISHELRTPLNVAMGYAAMLKDGMLGDLKPEQEDAIGKILTRSKDQLDMINNILLATAFESTGIPVERGVIILPELLNQLMARYSDHSLNNGVKFTWDCPTDLPPLEIDSAKLKHILQNLIDNAVKFTGEGTINLSARHLPEKKMIEFEVSDTGIGISPEHLPLIFEKFHQADSSETRSYGGVGLGLFIAKRFAHLLGGQIAVQSEPGEGSTFTVTIPCER